MDDGRLLIARIRTQKADDVIAEGASDKRQATRQKARWRDGEMLDGTGQGDRLSLLFMHRQSEARHAAPFETEPTPLP